MDAAGRQPVAQLVVVARIGVDGRELEPRSAGLDHTRERGPNRARIEVRWRPGGGHLVPERGADRHGVAAESHDAIGAITGTSIGLKPSDAAIGIGRQHVGDVELAHGDAVADVGPRDLAHQRELDAFGGGKTLLLRDDESRLSVSGRKPAVMLMVGHGSRSPAAVTRLCAISAILRFWFIAVLRSRA